VLSKFSPPNAPVTLDVIINKRIISLKEILDKRINGAIFCQIKKMAQMFHSE
jgi:hypothetical protein